MLSRALDGITRNLDLLALNGKAALGQLVRYRLGGNRAVELPVAALPHKNVPENGPCLKLKMFPQSGISCYIIKNWVEVKSMLDKELQKNSKAAGNLKQTCCKSKSRQELDLHTGTFQNETSRPFHPRPFFMDTDPIIFMLKTDRLKAVVLNLVHGN
jgi:hypothetical protein